MIRKLINKLTELSRKTKQLIKESLAIVAQVADLQEASVTYSYVWVAPILMPDLLSPQAYPPIFGRHKPASVIGNLYNGGLQKLMGQGNCP